ncbi:J domain-containing protein [Marinobacter sp. HN1S83]|uniref:J domain-containing protein n=1 Tax=Marinobacter sp. HN1S83 TaxID=3382301 RepID=UPI00387B1D9F
MTCWEILGIEPTRDPRQIEAAFERQSKFATGEEAERLKQAYQEAMGREPAPQVERSQPEESAPAAEPVAAVPDEQPLNANEQQVVREVVIQVNALLNDSGRSKDPQIWKAILGEPPADYPRVRREIGRSLEQNVRPMAENGTFPAPVARFLGEWFDWNSLTEVVRENREDEEAARDAQEQEAEEDLPPQMVNFWPAVIGWIVGLAVLATLFGGMGGGG